MAEFAANSTPISAHKALKAFELSQTYSVISGPLQRRNKPKSSFNESEKENLSDGSGINVQKLLSHMLWSCNTRFYYISNIYRITYIKY